MRFRIGSITKQFTAVAILLLAEEGRLRIEDPLSRYLPDYPGRAGDITLEHLLTHTSGIPNFTGMDSWLGLWRSDLALDELIALFKDEPLDFEPGERWAYSNSGYVLLTALIERVSERSYEEYLTSTPSRRPARAIVESIRA
jgi:CubicO group peptidase (beta-lactamase class C family)